MKNQNLLKQGYYSKLIEWREIMAANGYQHRVEEIQDLIDTLCDDDVQCVYTYGGSYEQP